MFTVDAQCARCCYKPECLERKEILTTLSLLANRLNTEPQFDASPGDGIIILSCHGFAIARPEPAPVPGLLSPVPVTE